MTRRERLEARLEKRREWAASRARDAAARFNTAHKSVAGIPPGQPILVGHHSERRHRAALDKHDANMRRGFEDQGMAKHHESKAAGLAGQLERAIFSDDPDAPERLQERIDELEALRERMKLVNKLHKKRDAEGLAAIGESLEAIDERLKKAGPYWGGRPHLPYELSNTGANITRLRERLKEVQARRARAETAESSPDGISVEGEAWVRVTFAEKPARSVLDALKAAGFRWSGGGWVGERAKMPSLVEGGAS